MIKVTITDNGYVVIDAAHADAIRLGITPYRSGSDDGVKRIAQAFAPDATLRRMTFRKKQGLSNMGWRAVFVDKDKQDAFVAAKEEK
jgi:hypothetical protein